jgi:hypothetical protein
MAKLDKEGLDELWGKFSNNPDSLNVNQYKSILDSAQDLVRKGEISREDAEKMIKAASEYC